MTTAMEHKPVATPLPRRILLWRQRFLPVVVWGMAVALVVVALQHQRRNVQQIAGVVEAREVTVVPRLDGTLAALYVGLYDVVEAGQLVAQLDDTMLRAESRTAEAEFKRLEADLAAAKLETVLIENDQNAESRRFEESVEQAKLDHFDRRAMLDSDRVALKLLEQQMNQREALAEAGVEDDFAVDKARLEFDALSVRIHQSDPALLGAQQRVLDAAERLQEHAALVVDTDDIEQRLQPFRAAMAVQKARINEIALRREQLNLRAPISGKVASIYHHTGETLEFGTPLLTITDTGGHRILAYVDERQGVRMKTGDPVDIVSRGTPQRMVTARVIETSPRVEAFPEHLLGRLETSWGQPILIAGFPQDVFRPGEAVTVYWQAFR